MYLTALFNPPSPAPDGKRQSGFGGFGGLGGRTRNGSTDSAGGGGRVGTPSSFLGLGGGGGGKSIFHQSSASPVGGARPGIRTSSPNAHTAFNPVWDDAYSGYARVTKAFNPTGPDRPFKPSPWAGQGTRTPAPQPPSRPPPPRPDPVAQALKLYPRQLKQYAVAHPRPLSTIECVERYIPPISISLNASSASTATLTNAEPRAAPSGPPARSHSGTSGTSVPPPQPPSGHHVRRAPAPPQHPAKPEKGGKFSLRVRREDKPPPLPPKSAEQLSRAYPRPQPPPPASAPARPPAAGWWGTLFRSAAEKAASEPQKTPTAAKRTSAKLQKPRPEKPAKAAKPAQPDKAEKPAKSATAAKAAKGRKPKKLQRKNRASTSSRPQSRGGAPKAGKPSRFGKFNFRKPSSLLRRLFKKDAKPEAEQPQLLPDSAPEPAPIDPPEQDPEQNYATITTVATANSSSSQITVVELINAFRDDDDDDESVINDEEIFDMPWQLPSVFSPADGFISAGTVASGSVSRSTSTITTYSPTPPLPFPTTLRDKSPLAPPITADLPPSTHSHSSSSKRPTFLARATDSLNKMVDSASKSLQKTKDEDAAAAPGMFSSLRRSGAVKKRVTGGGLERKGSLMDFSCIGVPGQGEGIAGGSS